MKMTPPTMLPQEFRTADCTLQGERFAADGHEWLKILDHNDLETGQTFGWLCLQLDDDGTATDLVHWYAPRTMAATFVSVELTARPLVAIDGIDGEQIVIATILRQVDERTRRWQIVQPLLGGLPQLVADPQSTALTELAPRWENYPETIAGPEASAGGKSDYGFGRYLANSLIISTLAVLGQVFSASLVAYGFARLRFRGRDTLFIVLLATLMIPAQVTLIPLFGIYKSIGWIDTWLPLIVPHFTAGAFNVFLLRQYMLTIPRSLDESAAIDGCGPLRAWWSIILPNCIPALVVVALFTFVYTWQDVMGPLIYIDDPSLRTVTLGLEYFRSPYVDNSHLLMAGAVLAMLPVAVVFIILQRHIMAGIATTGMKG